ncbi:hypothetical protein L1987_07010 [Smallanthus sonchifolius]|uniref:Uncharacterized protein n=1 Tax=Smallanthus sonchifolius TaxID=185202 RepID=A0ACB9JZW2_9ASTR|nr:hypothetical protein L1987_07010 [Smallanthus sonchifolius]
MKESSSQPFILDSVDDTHSESVIDNPCDETTDVLFGNTPLRYVGFDRQGSHSCSLFDTPNGTRYWCLHVSTDQKPIVGKIYNT